MNQLFKVCLRFYAVTLGLILVTALTVSAQAPTGVILGTVKDATGGTVAARMSR